MDVTEKPDCYDISVELPGISEKDVKVSLENDVLSISGEKKAEKVEDVKNIHISERHYGSFQRQFSLPDDADAGKVSAEFKNGVLKVTLGRSKKAKESARPAQKRASTLPNAPNDKVKMVLLAADGAKAQLYNIAPGTCRLTPLPKGKFRQAILPGRMIVSDRPGHSALFGGQRRSAMEPRSEPHARAETVFLKKSQAQST